jgi:hypothetical protein
MADWITGTRIRPVRFKIEVRQDGSGQVDSCASDYDMVLPSERAWPVSGAILDLTTLQTLMDQAAQDLLGQIMTREGVTDIWAPPP